MTANPISNDDDDRWTRTAPPERDSSLAREHRTDTVPRDFRTVKGWGADLDERNRPMVPAELPSDVDDVRGEVSAWQVPYAPVYVSVEHPNLTPVFGTSVPPRGLSGLLRSYAYKFGEGANRHWMTLILADRIDIVESLIIDSFRRPDNIVKEKGWKSRVKYASTDERQSGPSPIVIGAALLGAAALVIAVGRAVRD